jgi:hypothetical protein
MDDHLCISRIVLDQSLSDVVEVPDGGTESIEKYPW